MTLLRSAFFIIALIVTTPAWSADTLRDFCEALKNPVLYTANQKVTVIERGKKRTKRRRVDVSVPVDFGALFGDPTVGICDYKPTDVAPMASTTKVLTAVAALQHLDPQRPFDPRVRWQEVTRGRRDVIQNLELIGDGGTENWDDGRFFRVAQFLWDRGVREIHGNVTVRPSDSRWNHVGLPPWPAEDTAPNEQCGLPLPRAFPMGACPKVVLRSDGSLHWEDVKYEAPILRMAANEPFTIDAEPGINGAIIVKGRPRASFNVFYRDTLTLAARAFERALIKRGFDARSTRVVASESAPERDGTWINEPVPVGTNLANFLSDFLKHSRNNKGEALLRKLGIRTWAYGPQPGPPSDPIAGGTARIMTVVRALVPNLEPNALKVSDGCGLSLETKATAWAMQQVLLAIRNNEHLFLTLKPLLPEPGRAGTLRNRILGLKGRMRGKTGTLENGGVHSLVGYVRMTQTSGKDPLDWVPFVTLSKIDEDFNGSMASAGTAVRNRINWSVLRFGALLPERRTPLRP